MVLLSAICSILTLLPFCHFKIWERKLNLAKVELLKDLATATESVGIPDRLQLSPLWKDVHAQFHLPVDPNDCRITVLEPGETSTFRVHVENIEVSVTGKLLAGSMNLESLTDFQASVWLQFDTSLEISDNTIDGRLIVELEGGDGLTTATTMNGEALSITPLQRIKLREQLESAIFHELGWKINEAILASVKNILE